MDDLRKRYQNTFSSLGPSQKTREYVSNLRADTRTMNKHYIRRLSGVTAAAVLMLALLGCAVAGTVYSDSIQNWFAHHWETVSGQPMSDGQAAVIDHLSQDIGLSQTVDGVTVTVDSATVGDDTVFLLLKVSGKNFSTRYGYAFGQYDMDFSPAPVSHNSELGDFGFQYNGLDGDGSLIMLIRKNIGPTTDGSPMNVDLTLTDLVGSHAGPRKILTEGSWAFTFDLDRSHISESVHLEDADVSVYDPYQEQMITGRASNIQVTNTGIRFSAPRSGSASWHPAVILKDGAEAPCGSGTGNATKNDKTLSYYYLWSVPVDLNEVAAIRIGDTEIPIS